MFLRILIALVTLLGLSVPSNAEPTQARIDACLSDALQHARTNPFDTAYLESYFDLQVIYSQVAEAEQRSHKRALSPSSIALATTKVLSGVNWAMFIAGVRLSEIKRTTKVSRSVSVVYGSYGRHRFTITFKLTTKTCLVTRFVFDKRQLDQMILDHLHPRTPIH